MNSPTSAKYVVIADTGSPIGPFTTAEDAAAWAASTRGHFVYYVEEWPWIL